MDIQGAEDSALRDVKSASHPIKLLERRILRAKTLPLPKGYLGLRLDSKKQSSGVAVSRPSAAIVE
jgi:hypothetical protein